MQTKKKHPKSPLTKVQKIQAALLLSLILRRLSFFTTSKSFLMSTKSADPSLKTSYPAPQASSVEPVVFTEDPPVQDEPPVIYQKNVVPEWVHKDEVSIRKKGVFVDIKH